MKTNRLRLPALCLALALAASLTGCVVINPTNNYETVTGSGKIVTVEYQLPDYTDVELNASLNLVYSAEPRSYIELEAYENLVEHIQVRVEDGTLFVNSDAELNGMKSPTLTVYNPDLTGISIRGGATVTGRDTLVTDSFHLYLGGAADIKLDLRVNELDASLSGVGAMELTGTADSAKIAVSGVGDISADNLVVNKANISLSGVGSVSVHCVDELDARVSGAGSLSYKGSPKISQQISGAGSIQHIA